jgi:DNA polymerase-3 subunit delta
LAENPVVFILDGVESYGIEEFVESFTSRMGDPAMAELNTTRLDGRSASDEELRTAAASIPFLADRRLTILTHPLARLTSTARQKRFPAQLASLPPTTALILVVEDHFSWHSRERKSEWEVLKEKHWLMAWAVGAGKRAHVREFSLPKTAEMPQWIIKQAPEFKGQITPEGAQTLANLIGTDTQLASREIEKLLTYVDYQRPVEGEDVLDCTAAVNQVSVFDMIDALAEGNAAKALRLLHTLLEEEEAIGMFGVIVGHFRMLLIAREYQHDGGAMNQFMEVARKPKFVADKVYRQAQRFSLDELTAVYRQLAKLDESLKNGSTLPDLALETFVAEVGGKS